MKVGVFVGSFNPPHIGHELIIKTLLDNKTIDKVIVIPTKSYWDKRINTSLEDRINMLKYLANDKVIIDTAHNDYEYTYQILNDLSNKYEDLYLIIGSDNIVDFDKWKNIDEILNHHVIVLGRENIDVDSYLDKFDRNKFIIVDFDNDISSTFIRNQINKSDYDSILESMNPKVLSYIKKNNLYNE